MESKGRPGLGAMREESALNMFRQMDLKGKSKDDTQLKTVHQNTIATIRTYDEAGENVKKFSCEYSMVWEDQDERPDANRSQPAVLMDEWSFGPHEMWAIVPIQKSIKRILPNALSTDIEKSPCQWPLNCIRDHVD